jgi:hypothetical protein
VTADAAAIADKMLPKLLERVVPAFEKVIPQIIATVGPQIMSAFLSAFSEDLMKNLTTGTNTKQKVKRDEKDAKMAENIQNIFNFAAKVWDEAMDDDQSKKGNRRVERD